MASYGRKPGYLHSARRSRLLGALVVALVVHVSVILLPVTLEVDGSRKQSTNLDIRLTSFEPKEPEAPTEPIPDPPIIPEQPAVRPLPEPVIEPEPTLAEPVMAARPAPSAPLPERQASAAPPEEILTPVKREWDDSKTSTILARQFITPEPAIDKIFGKPIAKQGSEPRREFHFPERPNMITMLERPVPDLPFAYTPGLIHFAYDPGVRGDLQRFWDVITPEFGWRTKNGTEVRCKLILVIAGCAWK